MTKGKDSLLPANCSEAGSKFGDLGPKTKNLNQPCPTSSPLSGVRVPCAFGIN